MFLLKKKLEGIIIKYKFYSVKYNYQNQIKI